MALGGNTVPTRNKHFNVLPQLLGCVVQSLRKTYSMTSAPAFLRYSTSKTLSRGIHRTSGSSSRLMFSVGGANPARHRDTSRSPSSSSTAGRTIAHRAAPEPRQPQPDTDARIHGQEYVPLRAFQNKSWSKYTRSFLGN